MLAGLRLHGLGSAMVKGLVDLIVQIDPIGHEDDFVIIDRAVEGEGLGEHHHGDALPASLSVPDNAPLPRNIALSPAHAFLDLLDAEVLLISSHLLLACVEEHEAEYQLEESLLAAEGIERAVLRGYLPLEAAVTRRTLPDPRLPGREDLVDLALREGHPHLLRQIGYRFRAQVFLPDGPEPGRRPHRGVLCLVL